MSVERDIRYDLIARLCPNATGAELKSVATEVSYLSLTQSLKLTIRPVCLLSEQGERWRVNETSWTLSRRSSGRARSSQVRRCTRNTTRREGWCRRSVCMHMMNDQECAWTRLPDHPLKFTGYTRCGRYGLFARVNHPRSLNHGPALHRADSRRWGRGRPVRTEGSSSGHLRTYKQTQTILDRERAHRSNIRPHGAQA